MENTENMATPATETTAIVNAETASTTETDIATTASKAPTLTGAELIGRIYNVGDGRVARASSVSATQLFDLNKKTNTVNIGSMGAYSVSKDLVVDTTLEQYLNQTQTDIFYSKDVNTAFSVEVGVSGEVGAFSGEMSDCYSQTTSSHYESSMSMAKQYSQYAVYKVIMKGDTTDWRNMLKENVRNDINGTALTGEALVKKYGTHFLASGYFGGVWMYAQSISSYLSTNSVEITNTISASAAAEGVEISSTTSNSSSTTETNSKSQTSLYLDAIGGTTNKSYEDWQDSVNQGNWNLINFDNDTNISLQPLSVLVDPSIENCQARVNEIDEAIKAVLTPYKLQTLRWKSSGSRKTVDSGTVEEKFILDPETESNKVIVGLAFKVNDSNLKVLNAKVLDLDKGTTDWYATDSNGAHVKVTQDNTETSQSCDPGYVLTGMGLNAGNDKMYKSILYGQAIDVMNVDDNNYIGCDVKTFGSGNPDDKYVPQEGNDLIITGVEVGVYKKEVGALYLHFGKFEKINV